MTRLAYEGNNNKLYDAATAFFELLVQKSTEEQKLGIQTISHLFDHKVEPRRNKILMDSVKKVHDHELDKHGQFGQQRRCNQYPFDEKLRKKKKFKEGYNYTKILDRKAMEIFFDKKTQKSTIDHKISTQIQVDKLCRGTQLRVKLVL